MRPFVYRSVFSNPSYLATITTEATPFLRRQLEVYIKASLLDIAYQMYKQESAGVRLCRNKYFKRFGGKEGETSP